MIATARQATWLALPLLAGLGRISPGFARAVTFLLVGTVGVAHGANDDLILSRLLPATPGGRNTISLAYGATAFGVFALAQRVPQTATRALSLLSAFHFGSGDAAFARACMPAAGSHPVDAIVRGLIPLTIDRRRRPMLIVAAVCAVVHAFRERRADALDIAVPAATLALASESLGFAAYFAAWHAPRHLALVIEHDRRGGTPFLRLRTFARESLRNTLLAFALGALALALARRKTPTRSTATALILGITVPHQLAVTYAACRAAT